MTNRVNNNTIEETGVLHLIAVCLLEQILDTVLVVDIKLNNLVIILTTNLSIIYTPLVSNLILTRLQNKKGFISVK